MGLSKRQQEHYSRQLVLPHFGEAGQKKLSGGSVLVIGSGGLGCPAVLYLAAAGIGTIGIVDSDYVSVSNLQRQIVYVMKDIGTSKAKLAAVRCRAINPDVKMRSYWKRLNAGNILGLVRGYDFVLDCTDNFASKFLIADACHFARKPYSHAGIAGYMGQTMTVLPGKTACYRCVFNAPPAPGTVPLPDETGVLGPVPAVIGSIQAAEAIKFLIGAGDLLTGRLLSYNALATAFRIVVVRRNANCPLCGAKPSIVTLKS